MKSLAIAAVIAVTTFASPVVLLSATPAMAVDCSDPNAPESRPGGYCSLASGGGMSTLASNVTGERTNERECNHEKVWFGSGMTFGRWWQS